MKKWFCDLCKKEHSERTLKFKLAQGGQACWKSIDATQQCVHVDDANESACTCSRPAGGHYYLCPAVKSHRQ